jgi:membrane protein YdbS with pleckstrin-like domain
MAEAQAKSKKTPKPPQKYFEDQFDDEDVQFVFRKHPIVMRKGLIIGLSMWLVGPLIVLILTYLHPNNPPSLTIFFGSLVASILLGVLVLVPFWIGWYFSVYIVTDQRLIQITQKGMFARSVVDIALHQIQMINYEVVGLQETLLGFGTIRVQTYVGELVIHEVHHPAKTAKKLQMVLRDLGITPDTMRLPNQDESQITA